MATTLQIQLQLARFIDGQSKVGTLPGLIKNLVSTSDLFYAAMQVVGFAAEESLAIGDVTDDAMCVLVNEDPTNYIEVGYGSFTPFFKIPPGEFCILPRVSSLAAVKLRANTANVNVTILLYKVA